MISEIASRLLEARRKATPLHDFPGPVPTDLETAYAIQDEVRRQSGRALVGWKVAMIQPRLRQQLGGERLAGPLFADTLWTAAPGKPVEVAVFEGGEAALEAEFVIRLGRDLSAADGPFTPESVADAVASLHGGAEIAASPIAPIISLGSAAMIADLAFNGGAVVGPEIPDWRSQRLDELATRMTIDGEVVGEGDAANVPGGPLGALAFLAAHLTGRGETLRKGQVVLTGATTGMHAITPGRRGLVEFHGAGAIEVSVGAVEPA
ncbi:2-keto-4-pentenoate hydratase [Tistlia consotensis]|uniref:2-keto-4-pentenoate hydratase n=1 Tax=Tistlia consotensis USBA 355 TaxID=560819 RepID=A0A1Y6CKK8_9PROT|nr:fumarylacetoacetate hydrolase family protein [Tistlia consotensis]SMF71869.1 2-keto-4-pentenoate hydratase [Tistlia consotensis USBA 355]SNS06082.1 2-keto-4-pentenoate hydratase [Tistlia consotensis]